jgi:putative flippase GtrA
MNQKIKNLLNSEIVKYIFWGIATTIVSVFVYTMFVESHKLTNRVSSVPAFVNGIFTTISSIVGIIFAFYTNRKFVFKSNAITRKEKITEFINFFGARVTTLVLDLVLVIVGSIYFPGHELVVKIISQILVIIANYVLTKLVFSSKEN